MLEGQEHVDALYANYGDKPNQGKITQRGNAYLDGEFPFLSTIIEATSVE